MFGGKVTDHKVKTCFNGYLNFIIIIILLQKEMKHLSI